jgi:hypothetical protein
MGENTVGRFQYLPYFYADPKPYHIIGNSFNVFLFYHKNRQTY